MVQLIPALAFGRALLESLSLTERIPKAALLADPRITYEGYVPEAHYPQDDDTYKLPLIIGIHGTGRDTESWMTVFQEFANENKAAFFIPTFPYFLQGPLDFDGYHFLGRGPPFNGEPAESWLAEAVDVPQVATIEAPPEVDLRYDLLILNMLDEIAVRWPGIETSKIFLTGFSGGGQVAHRFLYLQPERLAALNVGAPGMITTINETQTWPTGITNWEDIWGEPFDVDSLKGVPILGSVGDEDTGGDVPRLRLNVPGSNYGTPEEVDEPRRDGLVRLIENWQDYGLDANYTIVPGVGHEMADVFVGVAPWLSEQIAKYWETQG